MLLRGGGPTILLTSSGGSILWRAAGGSMIGRTGGGSMLLMVFSSCLCAFSIRWYGLSVVFAYHWHL